MKANKKTVQGCYFAQKTSGEVADSQGEVNEQKRIYELILKEREQLLNIHNPVQFIFSHFALGVGWDNPNIFNIATLNAAFFRNSQASGNRVRVIAYWCKSTGTTYL